MNASYFRTDRTARCFHSRFHSPAVRSYDRATLSVSITLFAFKSADYESPLLSAGRLESALFIVVRVTNQRSTARRRATWDRSVRRKRMKEKKRKNKGEIFRRGYVSLAGSFGLSGDRHLSPRQRRTARRLRFSLRREFLRSISRNVGSPLERVDRERSVAHAQPEPTFRLGKLRGGNVRLLNAV